MRYSTALVLVAGIGALAHPGNKENRRRRNGRKGSVHVHGFHKLHRLALANIDTSNRDSHWTGTVTLGDMLPSEDDKPAEDNSTAEVTESTSDDGDDDAEAEPEKAEEPAPAPAAAPAPEPEPEPQPEPEPVSVPVPAEPATPKPQPVEPPKGTISEYAEQALDEHNILRAQTGAAPLEWSDSLAAAAKVLADRCYWPQSGSPHDTTIGSGNYGQNMAAGNSDIRSVIKDQWWNEVNNPAGEQGHYTQVVWKGSQQVGCATSSCGSQAYGGVTVCNYFPPGNVAGQYGSNV